MKRRADPELFKAIQQARTLAGLWGHEARKWPLQGLLETYRASILRTRQSMVEEGLVKTCSLCAHGQGANCCSEGMVAWYDPMDLMLNLLLGADLPEVYEMKGGCLFLGAEGCRLVARHPFCMEYLCPALREALPPAPLERFLLAARDEEACQWEVERFLRSRAGLQSWELVP